MSQKAVTRYVRPCRQLNLEYEVLEPRILLAADVASNVGSSSVGMAAASDGVGPALDVPRPSQPELSASVPIGDPRITAPADTASSPGSASDDAHAAFVSASAPGTVPASVGEASDAAMQVVRDFLSGPDTASYLNALFVGAGSVDPTREANIESVIREFLESDVSIAVILADADAMPGAFGAFGRGFDDASAIYLNREWVEGGASASAITRVLVEEIGHYIDARINPSFDTPGDEGEVFACDVLNETLTAEDRQSISLEDDHASFVIDGKSLAVELSGSIFDVSGGLLSFDNGVLKTGSAGSVGATYLYSNVVTIGGRQIDAVVKLEELTNATNFIMDSSSNPYSTSNAQSYLQPNITVSSAGGFARISISFIDGGTYSNTTHSGTAVTLKNVYINTYDLDGSGANAAGRQFTDFSGIGGFTLNSTPKIAVQDLGGGLTRFVTTIGGNETDLPGTADGDDIRARVFYNSLSSITVKVGDVGATGLAYFALDFSQGPTFNAPVIVGVTSVTVNEASPYAVFKVTGEAGAAVVLSTTDGSAKDGVSDSDPRDYSAALQYFNGSGWVDYTPGASVNLSAGTVGSLLVRTAIFNDSPAVVEGSESFTLTATFAGNVKADGTGTIVDDGVGDIFLGANNSNTPDATGAQGYPALDDDRPLSVNSIRVNEGSPYAVFTVTGVEGQQVKLSLSSGTATIENGSSPVATDGSEDFGPALEYWNGTAWTAYTANAFIAIPSDGDGTSGEAAKLLVRTAVLPDALDEGDHTFTLTATNAGGTPATGTATIDDRGGGVKYPDAPPTAPGTTDPVPVTDTTNLDDDRPLSVSSIRVNEGSPYAVFTVTGVEGQQVKLSLSSGTATIENGSSPVATDGSEDFGPALEYWNGTAWTAYTANAFIAIPSDGDGTSGEAAKLLVRTAVLPDALDEGDHTFTLTATNAGGTPATGTATIDDRGGGVKYPDAPPTAPGTTDPVPVTDTTNLDDDRPLSVNSIRVNEGSPYAVFTVTGVEGQQVKLSLSSGTATIENGSSPVATDGSEDFGPALEYWNGTAWTSYTANAFIAIPSDGDGTSGETAKLLVRTAVLPDALDEGDHAFTLTATNAGGTPATGTATIDDRGGGVKYPDAPPTAPGTTDPVPVTDATNLDDDRPLLVNSIRVNEGSPYAVFTVTGVEGQQVKLSLSSGTATIENGSSPVATDGSEDFGPALEYWNGTAWTSYTANAFIAIPSDGDGTSGETAKLLVRTAVLPDTLDEGDHAFTLTATNAGGTPATGTATIDDRGGGVKYPDASPTAPGTTDPVPVTDTTNLDDDRPLLVSSIRVNEGSPYAVFTVTGVEGQQVKLSLASGTATIENGSSPVSTDGSEDFGPALEYWNGAAWTSYTANAFIAIPGDGDGTSGEAAKLLVRTAVLPDALDEGDHTFTLTATNAGGTPATGTATIDDRGGGVKYPDAPPTAPGTTDPVPVTDTTNLDDDRPLSVSSIRVNEGSPYAVFTVTGVEGQQVKLSLSSGTATIENGSSPVATDGSEDFGPALEYWNGTAWTSYTANAFIAIPSDGDGTSGETAKLLVRTAVLPDTLDEGDHTFTLTATNAGGTPATGTATIDDRGGGVTYPDAPPTAPGTTDPVPVTDTTNLDDDQPPSVGSLTVTNPTVNEGSPYAVFTVSGTSGQTIGLALSSGTALIENGNGTVLTDGTEDFGPGLQYSLNGGTSWLTYSSAVTLTGSSMLVRTPVINDTASDNGETFALTATPTGGPAVTGTATIKDDGTGDVFKDDGTTDVSATKNDDRPLLVNSIRVNEGSPYAVFTVTGVEGQQVKLSLASGTATIENGSSPVATDGSEDFGPALEYWNGTAWTSYTANAFIAIPGDGDGTSGEAAKLLVRTAVLPDALDEGDHTFTLTATNAGGTPATGTATIDDRGGGVKYPDAPPTAPGTTDPVPVTDTTNLDDDRPLLVNSIRVNEGSPYAVFTVTGVEGQQVKLSLASGTATIENGSSPVATDGSEDFGPALEYWNGAAWTSYTANAFIAIPSDGDGTSGETAKLLVRTAVLPDALDEGDHTFTLTATNAGGTPATGTATIDDRGGGVKYPDAPPTAPGTTDPVPVTDTTNLDDDRPLSVSSIRVNEGSPYAVFTVTGVEGQQVKLSLSSGTATIENGSSPVATDGSEDFGPALEYWNGAAWTSYTANAFIAIPSDGDGTSGETAKLLVRTAVLPDTLDEGDHAFTLTATNAGGTPATGTATIDDRGGGVTYPDAPPTAPGTTDPVPVTDTTNLDDDRPAPVVSNVALPERQGPAVFSVTATPGQALTFALSAGNATVGQDIAAAFEISLDGGLTYTPYVGQVATPVSGVILVRVAIIDDGDVEPSEGFALTALASNGKVGSGLGTILDDDIAPAPPTPPLVSSPLRAAPPPVVSTAVTTPVSEAIRSPASGSLAAGTTASAVGMVAPPMLGGVALGGLTVDVPRVVSEGGVSRFTVSVVNTDSSPGTTYSATLSDGAPLPEGVAIDPSTGRLTGNVPPEGLTLDVRVTAITTNGARTLDVKLDVPPPTKPQSLLEGLMRASLEYAPAVFDQSDEGVRDLHPVLAEIDGEAPPPAGQSQQTGLPSFSEQLRARLLLPTAHS
jgi:hypothetical protein